MRKLLWLMSWCIGIVFALLTLVMLQTIPYSAIPLVGITLLTLPPARSFAARFFPRGLSFRERLASCAILSLTWMVLLVATAKPPVAAAPQTAHALTPAAAAAPPPAGAVPAPGAGGSPASSSSASDSRVEGRAGAVIAAAPPAASPKVQATAAGVDCKFEVYLVPPNGVFIRPAGLHLSAQVDDPRSAEVSTAINAFAARVAPGRDVLVAAQRPAEVTATKPTLDVDLQAFTDTTPGSVLAGVGLPNPVPKAAVIDDLAAAAVELARVIHPGKSIMTQLFIGEDTIDERYFAGNLLYDPATGTVGLMSATKGGSRTTSAKDRYLLAVQKHPYLVRNLAGKFFYTVELVYPKEPSADQARQDLEHEMVAVARTADGNVSAFVYIGTESKNPPWVQMLDPGDTFKRYLALEYSAKTSLVTGRGISRKLSDLPP